MQLANLGYYAATYCVTKCQPYDVILMHVNVRDPFDLTDQSPLSNYPRDRKLDSKSWWYNEIQKLTYNKKSKIITKRNEILKIPFKSPKEKLRKYVFRI